MQLGSAVVVFVLSVVLFVFVFVLDKIHELWLKE